MTRKTYELGPSDDLRRALGEHVPKRAEVYWIGSAPMVCNICGGKLAKVFVDGATKGGGPWAIMHPACHQRTGIGFGEGRGQRFVKQDDGRWLKKMPARLSAR